MEYDLGDQLRAVTIRTNGTTGATVKRYVYAYDKNAAAPPGGGGFGYNFTADVPLPGMPPGLTGTEFAEMFGNPLDASTSVYLPFCHSAESPQISDFFFGINPNMSVYGVYGEKYGIRDYGPLLPSFTIS